MDSVEGDASDGQLGGVPVIARGPDTAVLAKPAGMAAEMRADEQRVSLLGRVSEVWPEARLPHRLDRVTSGLQVVCRHAEAVARQNADIAAGHWTKHYVVRIPSGNPAALLGQHRRYLKRDGRLALIVRSGGKPAVLTIEAVAADPERRDMQQALVRLETGRYHQIRIMLADLGFPLVGDTRYGGRRDDEGPWLEHARLSGIDLGEGPVTVALPEPVRNVCYASAVIDRLHADT